MVVTDLDPPILISVSETDTHLVYQPTRMPIGRGKTLQLHTLRVPNGVVGPHKMKVVARHVRWESSALSHHDIGGLGVPNL